MPLEVLSGRRIPRLLEQAQRKIGEDAVVLSVRRIGSDRRPFFELVAADPDTADGWKPLPQPVQSPSSRADARRRSMRRRMPPQGKPVIVALVGPTGAGKTTTIAKLANHPSAFGTCAVGLVSLDTYRVGAQEQARIYAELSRIPLEVIYEARDIPAALHRLRDCDVLLVDTAGRGPGRQPDALATQARLAELNPYEVHLTLPAGLQPRRARRIVEEYLPYGVTHLIVTKTDECPEDRTPFRLAAEFSLSVLWITNGQEVPEDLRTHLQSPRTPSPTEPRPRESCSVGVS